MTQQSTKLPQQTVQSLRTKLLQEMEEHNETNPTLQLDLYEVRQRTFYRYYKIIMTSLGGIFGTHPLLDYSAAKVSDFV